MRKRSFSILTLLTGLTVAMLFLYCGEPVTPPAPGVTSAVRIAVTTVSVDYSAANFEIISEDNYSVSSNLIPGLYTDNTVRAFGGDVYILERLGRDNVVKYNTAAMAVEYQESIEECLNIQDIAVVSETKAYISCYQSGALIIFNPATGKQGAAIDLSQFNAYAGTDSAEAYPFASSLAVYGDYVYAACQRLKTVQADWGASFVPADTSLIAVIDTRTNTVAGSIKLEKQNPASMSVFGNRLLVSSSGDWYDAATAGVEMIDLSANQTLGLIKDGAAFGGALTDVIFISSNKAYAAAMTENWTTDIVEFNPSAKTVGSKITGISDGSGGLAYDGSKLYVGDRGFGAAGVVVINPSTNSAERTVSTNMPPAGLAVIVRD